METLQSQTLRRRLDARRNEIINKLKTLEADKSDPATKRHPDEQIHSGIEQRGILTFLSRWYLSELNQIEGALARLVNESYGVCLGCGAPIEIDLLQTFPEAEFCRLCQEIKDMMERG